MAAQFVERRVVTRAWCQKVVLKITHQQTASFEMPRNAFAEGMNEQVQCCRRWHRDPGSSLPTSRLPEAASRLERAKRCTHQRPMPFGAPILSRRGHLAARLP